MGFSYSLRTTPIAERNHIMSYFITSAGQDPETIASATPRHRPRWTEDGLAQLGGNPNERMTE
jgi:hypothetical protein